MSLQQVQMLPSLTADPVERRRLLNVLAQRRYRERKRLRQSQPKSKTSSHSEGSVSVYTSRSGAAETAQPAQPAAHPLIYPNALSSFDDTKSQYTSNSSGFSGVQLPVATEPELVVLDGTPLAGWRQDIVFPHTPIYNSLNPYDAQQESGIFDEQPSNDFPPVSQDIYDDLAPNAHPQTFPTTTSDPYIAPTNQGLTSPYATYATFSSTSSLYDDLALSAPYLSLLRAHVSIIQTIEASGWKVNLWDVFSISPFYLNPHPNIPIANPPALPAHYQPSSLQLTTKHHPIIDLLPWPSVRNRLLYILNLPMHARPERVRDRPEVVMQQFILDMKDPDGGVRVWGTDPYDGDKWEVGQKFFEHWWWVLDGEIVRKSNERRRARGEETLRLRSLKVNEFI